MQRPFRQVDVFGSGPLSGNPVAVVLDGAGLAASEMQRFANWTNLSETTFVLPPEDPGADYRVRIFTPSQELPFAGHPTLGTCHAWLEHGGAPRTTDAVVQECGAGLVTVARDGSGRLAFAAPPRVRSGPVADDVRAEVVRALGIADADVVDVAWADNGPGWVAVLLASAADVLAVRASFSAQDIGVAGPHPPGGPAAWEVRAFFPVGTVMTEDPVTGSLNAALAQWLFESGRVRGDGYAARQGTALGRAGDVHVRRDGDGGVWVGGATATVLAGTVEL